jgi:DNA polymerase-3 subunit epsilon
MAAPDHRIVLYDAQAAAVLSQIAPARLGASLGDYLERDLLEAAHKKMIRTGKEVSARITGTDGRQTYGVQLKPLGDSHGYVVIFDSAEAEIPPEAARPLIYDFALLNPATRRIEDRPLSDLSFAVFDTETTGLLPHKDQVVQLGALRVLRGRIVEGETLDLLVNPGAPIPAASTRVHGVTDAMVKDAPDITSVSATFHHFATDAVIVAHNAPFDMAFLRRAAKKSGLTWDHPVLDTVLLSAVLFGASVPHTLDALCERLDVTIPAALRHTALGDARATAEVLCRMLPMLEARGFTTLGDVVAQTRQHGRLLQDLNPVDKQGDAWQVGSKT